MSGGLELNDAHLKAMMIWFQGLSSRISHQITKVLETKPKGACEDMRCP